MMKTTAALMLAALWLAVAGVVRADSRLNIAASYIVYYPALMEGHEKTGATSKRRVYVHVYLKNASARAETVRVDATCQRYLPTHG